MEKKEYFIYPIQNSNMCKILGQPFFEQPNGRDRPSSTLTPHQLKLLFKLRTCSLVCFIISPSSKFKP